MIHSNRNYCLFLLATAFIGIGASVDGATLTNYLRENLGFAIMQRSALEFPRELPGFLVVFIIGLLSTLGDVRIAALANFLAAAGMYALGIISPEYSVVVLTVFVYSIGNHVYMPLSNSIAMSFATAKDLGKGLGRMNAVNTLAVVFSSLALWALFKFAHISYYFSFTLGAAAFILGALCLLFIKTGRSEIKNNRFVFRKEYGLYYWLCVLYGARKQIFITFGPWVLVDILHQPVTTMIILFFTISVIGIFAKPWIGSMIDNRGEKLILGSEAAAFFLVCLGYAFATDLFRPEYALWVICACYIADQTMSSVSMARATYMKKLALSPEDVSPSLSLGTSIDHLITMFLPLAAGYIWYSGGPNGYKYVFIGGAAIAVLNFISTRFISLEKTNQSKTISVRES